MILLDLYYLSGALQKLLASYLQPLALIIVESIYKPIDCWRTGRNTRHVWHCLPDKRSLGLFIMGSKMRMIGWLMWCSR